MIALKTLKGLEKLYGKSRVKTDCLGLGEWKLGESILFKDGKSRKLVHIAFRNIAVDLLRFDDGTKVFTGEINDKFNITEEDLK